MTKLHDGQRIVRPAVHSDAPALARLHAENFHRPWDESYWRAECDRPLAKVFIALNCQQAVGLINARAAADEAEVLTVAVASRDRRKGHARALLACLIDDLRGEERRRLFLEVDEHNAPARALYAAFKFQLVARRQAYYGTSDALVLSKQIGTD